MAFLATEDRFGPELDRYRQGEPQNPCTYTPKDDKGTLSRKKNVSGTFGYHRSEQHEKPSHFVNAASSSPAIAATLKALEENSLQHMRETSEPTPSAYAPTVEGQFPRAYTIKEILSERKRVAIQRKNVKNEDAMTAQELHLALGPGSYEVSKDVRNISWVKLSGYSSRSNRFVRVTDKPRNHIDSFYFHTRKASWNSGQYSCAGPFEAYRRGPGSYHSPCRCSSSPLQKASKGENNEGVCMRADCFQISPLPSTQRKSSTSFGCVASRDLLTSMIAAGHASAHSIGPGIYDAYPSSFILPTHNLGYKQEMNRTEPKSTLRSACTSRSRATGSDADEKDETRNLSQKELWNAMKRGPMLPS
ncbi:unnamed protein product [Phytophthora fragariaefolia]|uniref:Unnamed protein product n=1 Tax=Phytophthora fragariaefolia TaxID=1490495 RepID=A0A9W7CK09_9STRA|nr:unnamed protein product [Phytophthora fragariaefolia]